MRNSDLKLFGRWDVHQPSVSNTVNKKLITFESVQKIFVASDTKVVYVVDDMFTLVGCISKGDFLRSDNVLTAINHEPIFVQLGRENWHLSSAMEYNSLPVVNEDKRIVKILEKSFLNEVSEQLSFIAEIGNNHQGDIGNAKALVDAAQLAGADFVKFQARDLESLYVDVSEEFLRTTDYSTAYTVRQLKRYNLDFEALKILFDYCREKNIGFICTPFDEVSAEFLLNSELDIIKIASADLSNFTLLHKFNEYSGTLLISVGMHNYEDIKRVSEWAEKYFVKVVFLHTNSTYPTPFSDVKLGMMKDLEKLSTTNKFGYSGHERGYHIPIAAISLGASFIEKHFTFDKSLDGNDHKVSLLPNEYSSMVSFGRDVSIAISGEHDLKNKEISQGEALNQISLSKGVYLAVSKSKGSLISRSDVVLKSPCVGITPGEFEAYHKLPVVCDIPQGEPLACTHFISSQSFRQNSKFGSYGFPCRVRDINELNQEFSPAFLEYHLFSTDLEVKPANHKNIFKGKNFCFHAPEQFDDGFVLDLLSDDEAVNARSFQELDKIVAWVLEVIEYSQQDMQPKLITNVGGATSDGIFNIDKRKCFEKLCTIDMKLKNLGIDFRPQTMPPFPWHFGGQGFHNLFVDLTDLQKSQEYSELKFCLDVSHSWLSCRHLGVDFYSEVEKIKQYIDYVHLADAKHPGEEGIQLGTGEMNISKIYDILELRNGTRMWIPEIWKGHMENFTGFKKAMLYIESEV